MAKKFKEKPKGTVGVKFTVPSFRSGGVEYLAAEVEEAANAGNEEALSLIKKLIDKGASCIEVIETIETKGGDHE